MTKTKKFLLAVFLLAFGAGLSAQAFAAPAVTGVSGTFSDNTQMTISGSGFGSNGPKLVLYDNFEGGQAGTTIKTGSGSATIGQWDSIGGGDNSNPPKYDNVYSVSGKQSYKADFTKQTNSGTDSSSNAQVNNINTTDAFISYWVMLPMTSVFPCYNGGTCNWKMTWLTGTNTLDDDQVVMVGLPNGPTSEPYSSWYISCNNCQTMSPEITSFRIYRGNWYRISAWIHATTDNTSRRDLWVLSPNGTPLPNTKLVDNLTTQVFLSGSSPDPTHMFEKFILAPWARWCNNCTESAPRYDDVYVATGPNARARVEIGDKPTYSTCTNLSLATVNSWSDGSITATLRQGSIKNVTGAYLYVTDASGNVNSNGYPISSGSSSSGGTPPPACSKCPNPPHLNP